MVLREAIRQFAEGEDFWSMADITGDLTPEQACQVIPGAPYSIATNLAHALFWQDRWLRRLNGIEVPKGYSDEEDFPPVSEAEWHGVRDRFLAGVDEARKLSEGEPDAKRAKWLLQIVLHGSYHAGQISLLRHVGGFCYPPDTSQP